MLAAYLKLELHFFEDFSFFLEQNLWKGISVLCWTVITGLGSYMPEKIKLKSQLPVRAP